MRKKYKTAGTLIVLEGPDGVGKSTISKAVFDYFRDSPNEFTLLSFPGSEDGTLGKLVYDLHHEPNILGVNEITRSSNQLLHIAAHIDAIEQAILPQMKANKNIILDRFWWSAWVYGLASGVKKSFIKRMVELEKFIWKSFKPSAVFLLQRDTPIDRQVNTNYWKTLSHEYESLAEKESSEYPVFKVSNDCSIIEASTFVIETIKKYVDLKNNDLQNRNAPVKASNYQLTLDFEAKIQPKLQNKNISIFISHAQLAKPTIVYETYWKFAVERQNIFFKRINNSPLPWTIDPIIAKHKFTNAYRASDRVSQFLIRNVIYNENLPKSDAEVFFRIILFKLFNKIETWNLLEKELGLIAYENYCFERYDEILSKAMSHGKTIYSGAYIMPSGGRTLGFSKKHRNHLKLIEMMMKDDLYRKLSDCAKMETGFKLFRGYPTIGDFLAYQFITDVNYSKITNFSEVEFVVPGPGALDGIRKCFADRGGLSEAEVIRYVTDEQEAAFERLGLEFKSLWGRRLQFIDCQNLFCEVDKYSRVKHPEVSGITGRSRIKQIYKSTPRAIDYWYPPKWEINNKIVENGASEYSSNTAK